GVVNLRRALHAVGEHPPEASENKEMKMKTNLCRSLLALLLLTVFGLMTPLSAAAQDLLVSNYPNSVVQHFDVRTGTLLGNFAAGSGLSGPHTLAYGPDGNLYVASGLSNEVKRYDGKTGDFIDNF